MATIHPSRLGLVPQSSKDAYSASDRTRDRSPSPRHSRRRSPSRSRSPDRSRTHEDKGRRDRNGDGRHYDDSYEDRSRRRDRARADDFFDESRRRNRSRSQSLDRERDKERQERRDTGRGRRPSPVYTEYKRPPSKEKEESNSAPAPWRQQENMYPGRRERGLPPAGGADWLDSRRQQRESTTLSIWPPSPKAPTRSSLSPDPRKRKKSRKHRRDPSTDSSSDSEEERRRKERKERKRARKEKERDRERRKRKSRSRSVRDYSDSEDDRKERRKRRSRTRDDSKERSRSRHIESRRSRTRTKSPAQRPPSSDVDEDNWVEKPVTSTIFAATSGSANGAGSSMAPPPVPASALGSKVPGETHEDDSDDEVGPKPLKQVASSKKVDERQYGGALLRGEGSAMAAFLVDGTDVRIPRRGEIGLSSDEIASFEDVGYVMSGSRHRRMNAVRMRKENQVISAEEKRGILKLQQEERERREAILREEFQQLVEERLRASGSSKPSK